MKVFKTTLWKNIKLGYFVIPLGIGTMVFNIFMFTNSLHTYWQSLLLLIFVNLIGTPGVFIHLKYLVNDLNLKISYDPNKDVFNVARLNKQTSINKNEILNITVVSSKGTVGKIPWEGYQKFILNLKNDKSITITNLTMELRQIVKMTKLKNRQLNIINKFSWL